MLEGETSKRETYSVRYRQIHKGAELRLSGPCWSQQTEPDAETLESSTEPLRAAGKGERRATPPEIPTCGIAHLNPSRSWRERGKDRTEMCNATRRKGVCRQSGRRSVHFSKKKKRGANCHSEERGMEHERLSVITFCRDGM